MTTFLCNLQVLFVGFGVVWADLLKRRLYILTPCPTTPHRALGATPRWFSWSRSPETPTRLLKSLVVFGPGPLRQHRRDPAKLKMNL